MGERGHTKLTRFGAAWHEGRLKLVAVITERAPVRRILARLGLPTDALVRPLIGGEFPRVRRFCRPLRRTRYRNRERARFVLA
ncbi:MAG: hypothetical protein WBY94_31330 [Polyangiaceae bacterium]